MLDGERPAVRVRFALKRCQRRVFWPGWTPRWGWRAKGLAQVFADPRRGIDKRAIWRDGCLRGAAGRRMLRAGLAGRRIVSGGEMGELRAMVFARRPTRRG